MNKKEKINKKNFNFISDRIDIIQKMVGGNYIDPILDFKSSPDSFEYSTNTEDIRSLLPKKYVDFSKAINDLG